MSLFRFDRRSLSRSFSGNYIYKKNDQKFGEESFEIFKSLESKNTIYASNFMSRLPNGEFLNVSTKYEISDTNLPVNVLIQRSLGTNETEEEFDFKQVENKMFYHFRSKNSEFEYEFPLSKRIVVITPTFLTKCLFANNRKYEASARIPYLIIRSYNQWKMDSPPKEEHIFATFETQKMKTVEIEGEKYNTFNVNIFAQDTWKKGNEDEVPIHVNMAQDHVIPLKATLPDGSIIEITKLRKFKAPEQLLKT